MMSNSEPSDDIVNPRYIGRMTMNPPKVSSNTYLGSIKFFFLEKFLTERLGEEGELREWWRVEKIERFSFFFQIFFFCHGFMELEVFVHHSSPDEISWVESVRYGQSFLDLSRLEEIVRKNDENNFLRLLSEIEKENRLA